MLRSMTARQFHEWLYFAEMEPFGEDREDARFGSITQVLMNVNRNHKKRSKAFTLAESVVSGGDAFEGHVIAPRAQSWQEMKELALILTAASGRR